MTDLYSDCLIKKQSFKEINYKQLNQAQRCALAYRICALWQVDESTYTHISVRDDSGDGFWIKPHSMLFEEVRASNCLNIGLDGRIKQGDPNEDNPTGYIIHSSIYRHRPDVEAVIHLHTPASVAVSADPRGLRMCTQWALHFHKRISNHTYHSLSLAHEQGDDLARSLGQNMLCIMAHHGFVTCGRELAEALFYVHHFEHACRAQAMMSNEALNNELPQTICDKSVNDLLSFEDNLGQRDMNAFIRQCARLGHLDCLD